MDFLKNKTLYVTLGVIIALVAAAVYFDPFSSAVSEDDILIRAEALAKTCFESADYVNAAKYYEMILEDKEDTEDIYKTLYDCYTGIGDKEKAVAILETGIGKTGSADLINLHYIATDYVIEFTDKKLGQMVSTILGKPLGGELRRNEVETVTELDLSNKFYRDFDAYDELLYLKGLEFLALNKPNPKGLEKLSALPGLKTLYIYGNYPQNQTHLHLINEYYRKDSVSLDFLKDFKHLTELYVAGTEYTIDLSRFPNPERFESLCFEYVEIDTAVLSRFVNVSYIGLLSCGIKDVSFLAELPLLQILDLGYNKITDITPLAGLENLTYLNIEYNDIDNISSVKEMPIQKVAIDDSYLSLLDNSFEGIDFYIPDTGEYFTMTENNGMLSPGDFENPAVYKELQVSYGIGNYVIKERLESIEYLHIDCKDNTGGYSLNDLKYFKNLEYLYINNADLTNISMPPDSPELNRLILENCRITDLSEFKSLSKLAELSLYSCELDSISGVSYYPELNHIAFGICIINNKDLSSLSELKNLNSLRFNNCNLFDISSLPAIESLRTLEIDNDNISDISSIGELKGLTQLNLTYANVKDISPLVNLENLTSLTLYNNNIEDISPLRELKYVQNLHIDNNNVTGISPLEGMSDLLTLSISNNNISDLSPLVGLDNLMYLWVHDNPVTDYSYVEHIENVFGVVYG